MSADRQRVLVLTSDREQAVDRVRRRGVDTVVVVAERYRPLYDGLPGVTVRTVPSIDDLTAVREVGRAEAARGPVRAVVAATEKAVIPAGILRAYLGVPGAGPDVAFAFTHKLAMKQRLSDHGVRVAPFRAATTGTQLAEAADELGYPVVVKPVMGAAGKDTHRVAGPQELSRLTARKAFGPGPYLVEQHVDMVEEIECDAVVRDGRTVFHSVSRYFAPLLTVGTEVIGGSYVVPADDPVVAQVGRLHDQVVQALGARDAVTHLECFVTRDGLVVGEITCRPGGGSVADMVHRAWGVDLWDELVRAELGEPSAVVVRPAPGVHGWTYLRSGPEGVAVAEDLDGVVGVTGRSGGSVELRLLTDDAETMRRLHAEISTQVGR
jgi:biotin carboxylase